ncbi:EamA family transporter OS=Lysinibacillus sphaericus OX=1421 GN=LS41612_16620 PE=3 SV=1 [Lysinibacillus sphaericus]
MISMVEPVFTTLFALVFLNEQLQFSQLTGGMFGLISLVVLVYSQNKSIKKPAINQTLIQNEHI